MSTFLKKQDCFRSKGNFFYPIKGEINPYCFVCKDSLGVGILTNSYGLYKDDLFRVKDTLYFLPRWHTECIELFKLAPQLYV